MAGHGEAFLAACARGNIRPEIVHLPEGPSARLAPEVAAGIDATMLTRDVRFSRDDGYPKFCDAMLATARLKWIHFASTGVDQHGFLPSLIERGATVTSSIGSNGEPVAQTAIMSLLMLGRGFPHWLEAQRRKQWAPMRGAAQPHDFQGQTLLVVGMGKIGSPIARFARALGMRVIGIRRKPKGVDDPVDEMHPLSELPTLLPRCDWVVLACPLTPETKHIINAKTLALFKQGAALINVGRGGICDEPALIAALQSGRVRCAHLDVFETEPLPAESPLWDLPNVILTPHNASVSDGNDGRSVAIFIANLERYARGEPMENVFRP
jgi:phosphoglycerate dehydrogenase-like enzyme